MFFQRACQTILERIQPIVTIGAREKIMGNSILIGVLAKAAGCDVQTVRYYEKIGLLPKPHRSPGNQRLYDQEHLERLRFIRHCRSLGFSLDRIQRFLELGCNQDQPCGEIDTITRQCLEDVEEKIRQLTGLKRELQRMLSNCPGGTISECRIIQALSNHGQCLVGDHEAGGPD